jgi:GxGYxYP putative glycoside hydrolase C-terminal domain/GxGYxYP_N second domain/GxGYxYP third domain/GxGYxYP_N 1st domain
MDRKLSRRSFLGSTVGGTAAGLYSLSGKALQSPSMSHGPETAGAGNTVCPKSVTPARTLWAIRIEDLSFGYQQPGEHRLYEELSLACLQGLVNRKQPQIYLVFDRYDELWLEWLLARGDVDAVRWVGTEELYRQYSPYVKGLVVTDPNLPGSVNVATMLCSLTGWLPIAPDSAAFANWKVAMDLRGRWKKDIEAYRWFYSTYGSQLSDRLCAYLDPKSYELRDYFVEFKVPLIWVSKPEDVPYRPTASPTEEKQFASELFLKLPPNIPCLGWPGHVAGGEGIGEGPGVQMASEYAKFEVCTGYDGHGRAVSNLSVHSGTFAEFSQKECSPPPLKNRVYFTYTRTDGDGMNFWRQVYHRLWGQPDRGLVPVGWQLGPTGYDLCPDIIDYYYRHASQNDVFVNALTGIGYIRETHYAQKLPESEREKVWNQYIEISSRYFKLLDLSLLTTMERMSPALLERFTKLPGIQGIFANYSRVKETTIANETLELNGVQVFRTVVRPHGWLDTMGGRQQVVGSMVADIRRFTPSHRPAFLEASLTNWQTEMDVLVEIEKALGPECALVCPDQLVALYKAANGQKR